MIEWRAVGLSIALALCLVGCRGFSRVSFHYTSDVHIAPSARFLEVHASPEVVRTLVTEYVTRNQGRIDLAESKLSFRFAPGPKAEAAFEADRRVAQQEWKAYAAYRFRDWKNVDRTDPVLQEPVIVREDDPAANSSFVRATMLMRSTALVHSDTAMITPTVAVTNSWTTSEALESRLYVWWWPIAGGKTVLYARGLPFMPAYQVEAELGASVAYPLWTVTTGEAEAKLVTELFASVASRAREGRASK